jgi:hypothetical protein
MMKVKKETIKELESLKPNELMMVYDLILSFKERKPRQKVKEKSPAYIRVRNALKQCKGSLSSCA